MRIELLDEAKDDLIQGFHFYEGREGGLGAYFLDCLFSDIDSLLVYAGIHQPKNGSRGSCKRAIAALSNHLTLLMNSPFW